MLACKILPTTTITAMAVACLCCLLAGCQTSDENLQLKDLTQDEYQYIQRMVVLERAKAISLIDQATGFALLDSLALAWGDSALVETQRMSQNNPLRSAAVGRLLNRILIAERDSLIQTPRPEILSRPLPDPPANDQSPSKHPAQSRKS